ncbi:hypothetical protein KP79_PYT02219 [Mizuhopecten yessoensis]|uniref:Mutator-like transposase domain-containing protein n=1 Tax=Mizuhopecten yessoensis TaxID=6573 RepID=A0A210PXF1_MIZYE|nr:hypothetical protein KP79_PYT02219 [Mizuhopecten yessoensis]
MSANIPAPSKKGMQKSINKVGDQIEELNKIDMDELRKRIKEINTHRGNPPNKVDLMGDAIYKNPIYSGAKKTPFQPATQVMFSTTEHNTKDQYVVDLVTKNKLCIIWKVNIPHTVKVTYLWPHQLVMNKHTAMKVWRTSKKTAWRCTSLSPTQIQVHLRLLKRDTKMVRHVQSEHITLDPIHLTRNFRKNISKCV